MLALPTLNCYMMKQLHPVYLLYFFLLTLLFSISLSAKSSITETYYQTTHQQQFQELRTKAQSQVDKNLNRFGLEWLKKYDVLSDSIAAHEKSDTVAAIVAQFNRDAAGKLSTIAANKSEVEEYGNQNTVAKKRFLNLFTKSLMALGVWLLVIFIMIRMRNKKLRKVEAVLAATKLQALSTEEDQITAKQNDSLFSNKAAQLADAAEIARESHRQLEILHEQLPPGDAMLEAINEALKIADKLAVALNRESFIAEKIAGQISPDNLELTACSINDLCDQYLEIAYQGHIHLSSPPFECIITKDLEKNLQPIQLHPTQAGAVLLNVFDNAFRAVKDRASKNEKGYKPSVGVSTRILPRFLQIRIKDNGDGIPEGIRDKILDEFYSTRATGEGAGAGLAEAKRILTTLHKGEIVIESETGKGTDVYLKLFR